MRLSSLQAIIAAGALYAAGSGEILAADPEVEGLKDQVKVLQGKVAELEKGKAAAPAPPAGAAEEAAEAPAGSMPPGRASPVMPRGAFNDEQEAAPRLDDLTLDPKYLGFIPVPRTPAMIKLNAKPRVDFTWDPQNTGDNTRFITAKIPVEGSSDYDTGSVFNINAKGSRLSLDVRAPQVAGNPRFYFENDFYGSGDSEFNFRVRHVYGQFYNVIVGQTFSVFEDPDIWPDTVDFEGPNSQISQRNPLVRYQLPISEHWNLNFGLEQPASKPADFYDGAATTTVSGANHAPDGGVNARWDMAKVGHVQISSIFREIGTKSFTVGAVKQEADSVFGWGLNLSAGFQVLEKDSVQAQLTYGHGIGSYGNDSSFFKNDAAFDSDNHLVALPYLGIMLGYTHWWAEQWRSSVSYGYVNMENETSQGPTAYNRTHYASLNLVWQLRKRLSVGLEALYGFNQVKSGDDGDAWRMQVGLIYKLFD